MNDHERLDTGPVDVSTHDQTSGMSLDTALSIREAAARADVTEKTIRRWIKSGRLHAVKLGGQYRITVADLETARNSDDQTPDTQRPDSGQDSPRVDMSRGQDIGHVDVQGSSIDLRPLVDHIANLEKQVGQLSATAAMWQTRAAHLEDQLKQLTAGEILPESGSKSDPGTTESDDTGRLSVIGWLRRLLSS